jgi:hypothetical protein
MHHELRDYRARLTTATSGARRALALAGVAAALWLLGCVAEVVPDAASSSTSAIACGDQYLEAIQGTLNSFDGPRIAGETTSLEFHMGIGTDPILQTYQVVITAPSEFGFLGFDALGSGARIGQWDFEFANPDAEFDPNMIGYTIPHYAIDANSAYSDSLLNGVYDVGVDPIAVHSTGGSGEHVFTLTLPNGGTNQGGNCSFFATDTRYTLLDGIVHYPNTPGDYQIAFSAVSVDPDTGDADDGAGTAPTIWNSPALPITVPEPSSRVLRLGALVALGALACRRRAFPVP